MYSQSPSNIHSDPGLIDIMSIFPGLQNHSEPFSSKGDYFISESSSDATASEVGGRFPTYEWINSHQAVGFDTQHQEPTSAHHVVSAVPPVQPVDDLSAGPQSLAVTSSLGVHSLWIVPQEPYRRGLCHPGTRLVPTITYSPGLNLQSIIDSDFSALESLNEPAWVGEFRLSAKAAIVFCFPGHPQYSRQVCFLRAGIHPPTRSKLATLVAREMARFLVKARNEPSGSGPFRRGHTELTLSDLVLSDLVLVDVRQVSKGSFQPTLALAATPAGFRHTPPGVLA